MNKRINGIVEKAGFHWHGAFVKTVTLTEEDVEKFAELIIRECDIVIKDSISTMERGKLRASIARSGSLIKEHFGVKE